MASYDLEHLPDDPDQLKAIILALAKSNTELHAKLDKMTVELQRITRLFEKFFNKSSERLADDKASKNAADELESPQASENTDSEQPKGKRKKGGGGRNPLPPDLPRVEQVVEHEVPMCDVCGKPFKCIGEERSEQ